MSDTNSAETPAPEPDVTATPAPATDISSPDTQATEAPKTFTQEELDAIVSKRLAREQRKWEREQRAKPAAPPAMPAAPLDPADFDNAPAYAEAMAERKAAALLAQREAEAAHAAMLDAYRDREEEARGKYADFEQVAYNPTLPVTDVMAQTIQSSEIGPDLIYHLGSNPKEAERISRLSPLLQAREIGKIEARLAADPPARKTTSAPAPIAPVTARSTSTPAYDTTDPRSIKSMSTSEWIAAERARQAKRAEDLRNRYS
jgi:hypothetical protein